MGDGINTTRRELLKTAGVAAGLLAAGELLDPTRSGPKAAKAGVGAGRTFRVLSLDGGGIRGIIPATVLVAMEQMGGPICNMFDLIAGTSTGGIIACGLVVPGENGQPKLTAQQILDLYTQQALEIFMPYKGGTKTVQVGNLGTVESLPQIDPSSFSLFGKREPAGTPVSFLDAIFQPKYTNQGLQKLLADNFGTANLSQTLKPILCTALDLSNQSPYLFKTLSAGGNPAEDFPLTSVAQSTGAAPVFFPASVVSSLAGGTERYFADGGLAANNPSALALSAANQMIGNNSPYNNILMVSIGTGKLDPDPIVTTPPQGGFPNWGMVSWAVNGILNVLLNAPTEVTSAAVGYALDPQQYVRIQPPLSGVTPLTGQAYNCTNDMDDCTQENLDALKLAGQYAVEYYGGTLASIVRQLTAG